MRRFANATIPEMVILAVALAFGASSCTQETGSDTASEGEPPVGSDQRGALPAPPPLSEAEGVDLLAANPYIYIDENPGNPVYFYFHGSGFTPLGSVYIGLYSYGLGRFWAHKMTNGNSSGNLSGTAYLATCNPIPGEYMGAWAYDYGQAKWSNGVAVWGQCF